MTKAEKNMLEELFSKQATVFDKQASAKLFKTSVKFIVLEDESVICLKPSFPIKSPEVGDIFKSKDGKTFVIRSKQDELYPYSKTIDGEEKSIECIQYKVEFVIK